MNFPVKSFIPVIRKGLLIAAFDDTQQGTKQFEYTAETASLKHKALRCRQTPNFLQIFTVIKHSLEIDSWKYWYQMDAY